MALPVPLIINKGVVESAPPRPKALQSLPGAITEQQYAEEQARRARYQDELDSAERLRMLQAEQRYLDAGLRPPSFVSEFAPPSSASINALRPRFQNVRGDLYDVTSGVPKLVVDTPDDPKTRQPIFSIAERDQIPLPENYVWAWGPSGWVQQPARRISFDEAVAERIRAQNPQLIPSSAPSGIRSFATEEEAEKAGLKKGERVVIGGVPGTWSE